MDNFNQYMKRVDAELTAICGLSSGDLGAVCYYDMFNDEISPYDAALECLEQSDFPMDLVQWIA